MDSWSFRDHKHDFLEIIIKELKFLSTNPKNWPSYAVFPKGPCLALHYSLATYINDRPRHIYCHLSLFADDTLIHQTKLFSWSLSVSIQYWCCKRMGKHVAHSFNVLKCSTMSFNKNPESLSLHFTLVNTPLNVVQETKYLEVARTWRRFWKLNGS